MLLFEVQIPRSVKAIVEAISAPNRSQGEKKSTFSYGIVQLMMHSLDPTTDGNVSLCFSVFSTFFMISFK